MLFGARQQSAGGTTARAGADPPAADPPVASDGAPLLLDHDHPPAAQRRRTWRSAELPAFLRLGGYGRAWGEAAKAVAAGRAVVIHGPHGCGKTAGVHELTTKHLGLTVYEINAGSTEGIEAFGRDVRHVTRTKTLLGPRIVLVDDLEGFDDEYVRLTATLLREHQSERDTALVVTCANLHDRRLAPLSAVRESVTIVRMYTPSLRSTVAAVRLVSNATSIAIESACKHANGNLHQLFLRLRLHLNSQPDLHADLFKATDGLLTGRADVHLWGRAARPDTLVALLHENAPTIVDGDAEALERLACFLDVTSRSARVPEDSRLEQVGRAAQQWLHTPTPPPLHLSRQPALCPDGPLRRSL